jgi:hypothetical protein
MRIAESLGEERVVRVERMATMDMRTVTISLKGAAATHDVRGGTMTPTARSPQDPADDLRRIAAQVARDLRETLAEHGWIVLVSSGAPAGLAQPASGTGARAGELPRIAEGAGITAAAQVMTGGPDVEFTPLRRDVGVRLMEGLRKLIL